MNQAGNPRNPVSTAVAAQLTAAEDTCMGSTSAGAQGVGFGVSLGSTWKDSDCVRRKDARELHNMGMKNAALALMCKSADVREAMETAGTPCPDNKKVVAMMNDEPTKTSKHKKSVISESGLKVDYDYPASK
jgi:hypothetical protein